MTFGEKVRSLRKEKKMSQQELASMVGVSYRTIRSWEVEGRFPKQNVLYQKQAAAMFAGGSLTDEDKIAFMDEIQSLYLDSKRRAKKFTPKKYLKNQEEK